MENENKEKRESLELKNDKEFVVDKAVSDAVNKVLNANLPKEAKKNLISVGNVQNIPDALTYYNPHNCRVYYFFKKENFNPLNQCPYIGCDYSLINSTEHQFENFNGFTIRVKKNFVEVRPLNNKWNVIELDKIEVVELREERIRLALLSSCTESLKDFVKVYGGKTDFKIHHWRILENKHMGDNVTKKIPIRSKWRNSVTKKVYNEKNIEIDDGVSDVDGNSFYSNYTKNLCVKYVAPEIANELKMIREERLEFNKALTQYTEQINLHLKVEERQLVVQEESLKTFRAIQDSLVKPNILGFLKENVKSVDDYFRFRDKVVLLSDSERWELEKWLFSLNKHNI